MLALADKVACMEKQKLLLQLPETLVLWPTSSMSCTLIHAVGNIRCHSTADTPSGSNEQPPVSPDISKLSPELQQQWHLDRNMHLGAVIVRLYSQIKAVWKCDQCPAGQPHVWTTTVASRTKGTNCPYCSSRRLCLHNCLATVAPEVAH